MRKQFVEAVTYLMNCDNRVVLLLGDIGVFGFQNLKKRYPTRVYNIGICEQTMVSLAAGLSMSGLIPILHTISPFLVARAYEQIRDDFGFQNLIGTFVGVDVYSDHKSLGLTHSCPEDTALMSHVPNMKTFIPTTTIEFDEFLCDNYDKSLNYIRIYG